MEDNQIKEKSSITIKDKESNFDSLSSLEDGSLEKNIELINIIFDLHLKQDNNGSKNKEEYIPF